jgi:FMN phosphatase YigB (HAD superfamily)
VDGSEDPQAIGAALLRPDLLASLAAVPRELIVDMDDTLNTNAALFGRSFDRLLEYYGGWSDLGPVQLLAEHTALDRSLVDEFGYTPQRWRETAMRFAVSLARRKLTGNERQAILAAAELAFGAGELYPGVPEALQALRASGLPAVLKTKGDPELQARTIVAHRLREYFSEIEIVERKDVASFTATIERLGWQHPVSIGDRLGADIEPAVAAGARGILVSPSGIADWEREHDGELPKRTLRAPNFPAALLLLANEQRLRTNNGCFSHRRLIE